MKAIDVHVHAFPDSLAPRAIAQLESAAVWRAVGDGTIDGLLESMDSAGIESSAVCTIATRPEQVQPILTWCGAIRSRRIVPLASVHPQTGGAGHWVRRIAAEGFVGIKLHPLYQAFAADDRAMDEIYAAAADEDLLIAIHCGRDIAFDPADDRASPARVATVARRHPDLKLLCTHMGGYQAWQEAEAHLIGTGVYLETSFSIEQLGPDRSCELIRRHGTDRVLFGTDWPWTNQAEQMELIGRLDLTDGQEQMILHGNAAALFAGRV